MSRRRKRFVLSWLLLRVPLLAAFSVTASYVLAYYFP
jgi:hypothetical protein